MIYWDTCCILKLYAQETDSEYWLHRASQESSPMIISQLTRSELSFALVAKEKRNEIRDGASQILLSKFESDIDQELYHLVPLAISIISRSMQLAQHMSHLGLRTLDGLHLASALESGCSHIATQDHRLLKAAREAGLETVTT